MIVWKQFVEMMTTHFRAVKMQYLGSKICNKKNLKMAVIGSLMILFLCEMSFAISFY